MDSQALSHLAECESDEVLRRDPGPLVEAIAERPEMQVWRLVTSRAFRLGPVDLDPDTFDLTAWVADVGI